MRGPKFPFRRLESVDRLHSIFYFRVEEENRNPVIQSPTSSPKEIQIFLYFDGDVSVWRNMQRDRAWSTRIWKFNILTPFVVFPFQCFAAAARDIPRQIFTMQRTGYSHHCANRPGMEHVRERDICVIHWFGTSCALGVSSRCGWRCEFFPVYTLISISICYLPIDTCVQHNRQI